MAPSPNTLLDFQKRLDSDAPLRLLGLGDSLTYGWMVATGFYDRFVERVKRRFVQAAISSDNAGIPGDTAAGGLSRLPNILSRRPDMVTVQFGLNDMNRGVTADAFEQTITAIATALIDVGSLPVLVTSCPLSWPEGRKISQRFYDRIRNVADTLEVPVASLDEHWRRTAGEPSGWDGLMQGDDVHPTDEGHALMADALYATVIGGVPK